MKITTIGLDVAKNTFHVVCFDERFKERSKKMLRRHQVLKYFANIPVCCVAMEACSSANHWARQLINLGHEVKLIPAQHVKRFLPGNKNDYNDARAIAEASTRDNIRTVAVKTIKEQDIQALHRIRSQCKKDRTALVNSVRGLLSEYGIAIAKGISSLRRAIPELLEDADNGLSDYFRDLLARRYDQLIELDGHIKFYTQKLEHYAQQDEACQRLQTIPGFGPLVSSAFLGVIGNGEQFSKGRDAAASLGLVPRQHGTGGKTTLLGISKRGDKYLRSLLIHGARSVVTHSGRKDDPLVRWVNRVQERRGKNKAIVALANKMARIGWAVLRHRSNYQAQALVLA